MGIMRFYYSCLLLGGVLTPVQCLSDEKQLPENPYSRIEVSSSIEDYQAIISQLQVSIGPHSEQIIQPLLSIGVLQHENARYTDAGESFSSALHLHRINHGLQDLEQLPILELLISNNISQQNWSAVNDNYHNYQWLHRRNYTKTDPEMLVVIDKLIAWHLLATNLDTGTHPGEHFITLLDLHERALHIVENFPDQDDLELARRLYKLALVHYYIAVAVLRGSPVGEYLIQEFDPIQLNENYKTVSKKIVRKRYRRSRELVSRLVTIYENRSPTTTGSDAIALIYLADWDLLFNRHVSANRGYKQAHNRLLESGYSREAVNSFFLQPKLLPSSDFYPDLMVKHLAGYQLAKDKESSAESMENNVLDFIGWSKALPGVKYPASELNTLVSPNTERFSLVSFDVLKDGLTKNINISKENPESSLPRRTTYEAIWSAQFRPRLLDGKAVAVSGMSTRFYLPSIESK